MINLKTAKALLLAPPGVLGGRPVVLLTPSSAVIRLTPRASSCATATAGNGKKVAESLQHQATAIFHRDVAVAADEAAKAAADVAACIPPAALTFASHRRRAAQPWRAIAEVRSALAKATLPEVAESPLAVAELPPAVE